MTYDKRKEFEEYIKPHLTGLKRLCLKYDLPFFFTTCVENTDKESVYESEMYSGLAKGLDLTNDYFPNLAKVMKGFDTKFPKEIPSFEPDEMDVDFISELESLNYDD